MDRSNTLTVRFTGFSFPSINLPHVRRMIAITLVVNVLQPLGSMSCPDLIIIFIMPFIMPDTLCQILLSNVIDFHQFWLSCVCQKSDLYMNFYSSKESLFPVFYQRTVLTHFMRSLIKCKRECIDHTIHQNFTAF